MDNLSASASKKYMNTKKDALFYCASGIIVCHVYFLFSSLIMGQTLFAILSSVALGLDTLMIWRYWKAKKEFNDLFSKRIEKPEIYATLNLNNL